MAEGNTPKSEQSEQILEWMADTVVPQRNKAMASPPNRIAPHVNLEQRVAVLQQRLGNPPSLLDALCSLYVDAVFQRAADEGSAYRVLRHRQYFIRRMRKKVPCERSHSIARYLQRLLEMLFPTAVVGKLIPYRRDAPHLTYDGFRSKVIQHLRWSVITEHSVSDTYEYVAALLGKSKPYIVNLVRSRQQPDYALPPRHCHTDREFAALYCAYVADAYQRWGLWKAARVLKMQQSSLRTYLIEARALVGEPAWESKSWHAHFFKFLRATFPNYLPFVQRQFSLRQARDAYIVTIRDRCSTNKEAGEILGIHFQTIRYRAHSARNWVARVIYQQET
ncbi:hypothetical protein HYS48_03490 [Candidatus Woesearchaeota archaeon]|nr:hypothetical protein [Candidatus Woesearchaeota archaeon]